MAEAAKSNGNASVFELEEAEMYVNGCKTLKELGVKALDIFDFLGSLAKSELNNQINLTKKDNDFTYTMTLDEGITEDSEGILKWNADSLAKIRTVYPNAEIAYLKNGKVVILDKAGKPVYDRNGNPLEIEFKEHQRVFSEDLAEMIVLGHKADPMEKLMHQAEIQAELNRLNSLETPSESYLELSRSIAFQKMNKKEQVEAMLLWTGEKFYDAKERGDYAAMKEYLVEGFGLAFQKMDMASIGNTNISIEGFKDFLKTWSGLNMIVKQLDKTIDDGNANNLSEAEKIWAFTKGVGDAVDSFIGTQGIAFMGTLALAGEAAAAGGIGEAWAVTTQAYFAYEGIGSVAEGVQVLENAETEDDYRQSGSMIGNGAIMLHGAYKSFKGALTGKLQAGIEMRKAIKEIKECKSMEEIKELRENLSDLPYSEEEIASMNRECIKRMSELAKEEGNVEAEKPRFGLEEDMTIKPETEVKERDGAKIEQKTVTKEEAGVDIKRNISNEDMQELSKLIDKYPQYKNVILDIVNSNKNINNVKDSLSYNIEFIIKCIEENPDYTKEIVDYMKIQRRADNDTTNPVASIVDYVETLKKYLDEKDFIIELSKNSNLDAKSTDGGINTIEAVLNLYLKRGYVKEDIVTLCHQNETAPSIRSRLITVEKYPELRSILLKNSPEYQLVDNNPANTPNSVMQKRAQIKQYIEQNYAIGAKQLRQTLGNDFYKDMRWEDIIPEDASPSDIQNILTSINESSKFFARTSVNESKYGKNIQWASKMNDISDGASFLMSNGNDFDNVLGFIAEEYHSFDTASTLGTNNATRSTRRVASGKYRGDDAPEGYYQTPFFKDGDYSEYFDRFVRASGTRKSPYDDMELTQIMYSKEVSGGRGVMYHPANKYVEAGMQHIREKYNELQPLFDKVKSGQNLSKSDINIINDKISEIYFLMANTMPYQRGSNGISDILMRSIYKRFGINQPAVKHGVSLDLEAFCMDIDLYKQKWNSFFEKNVY